MFLYVSVFAEPPWDELFNIELRRLLQQRGHFVHRKRVLSPYVWQDMSEAAQNMERTNKTDSTRHQTIRHHNQTLALLRTNLKATVKEESLLRTYVAYLSVFATRNSHENIRLSATTHTTPRCVILRRIENAGTPGRNRPVLWCRS